MKTGILVTTYNWPSALKWVLFSITQQARLPDEVVVADDGSTEATRVCCEQFSDRLPLRHVWQPDYQFRAARVRNLAMSSMQSDHVIMIDGDCLLAPNFVGNHIKLAKPGCLVAGGRHLLSNSETHALLSGATSIESAFSHWKFWSVPLGLFRDLRPTAWETVRTCNLGLYREDIEAVGGFDESYVGWGREDSDFVVRLMHHGTKVRLARLATCVAHLHHPERSRDQLSQNDVRFHHCLNDPTHIHSKSSILGGL